MASEEQARKHTNSKITTGATCDNQKRHSGTQRESRRESGVPAETPDPKKKTKTA